MKREEAERLRAPIAHAEQAAALAVVPLVCAHGAQGAIGAVAVVLGKMVAGAHAQGLLEGSVAENMARIEALIGCGLHEQVTQNNVRAGRA
ncbi:hypothetical protein KTR66_19440 [Roseococcus sp. SDR]|uniref:hypothetical protein n=1 Tax=Roseococcus sp. SDR TaxID=2835532 RepID=UPI001BCCCBAF|nr:hypothetical protein [Roseococcus sp. SDR]MBS7792182.1 hypothetical protein [Roseococcus sp. SDR]MBV1847496.1 hypothetical protein [Roseococcus sp. SDR]